MSDDLISRQAAIEEIARWIGYIDEDMISRIQTGLKKMSSAQRWIPASERLPEEPFGCIVSFHGFMLTPHGEREYDAIYPELLGYDGTDWNNSEGECVDNMIDVTAWMPLPEPYKEGNDE